MGRIKGKSALEHMQNVRILIILHICKVSFRYLFPIETIYSIQ